MTRILTVYPNCSMGGMTTVFKNRIASDLSVFHQVVFMNDHGARGVFEGLSNARVDIPKKGRLEAYLRYIYSAGEFDEVRVTSIPDVANALLEIDPSKVVYEFHSSTEKIIEQELSKLNIEKLEKIIVPSAHLYELVSSMMPSEHAVFISVVENVVDSTIFFQGQPTGTWEFGEGTIPLVWIGRFDKGKNPRDFLRALSQLKKTYIGIFIVSMESEPERAASFMADVVSYGLDDRVHVMMNLPQEEIASLYRYVVSKSGLFVSTSLGESFGFGVAEALACGLDTVAFEVGALSERKAPAGCTYSLVDVGDIHALHQQIVFDHELRLSGRGAG